MPGPTRARRVLVVDDEGPSRRVLARMLRSEGWEVEDVGGAEEALIVAERRPPDVVLTDLRMPGMDGVALIEALRRQIQGLPVVLVTASADVASASRAIRAGAVDYLTKPIELDDVLRALDRAVHRERPDLDPEASRLVREIGEALAGRSLDVAAMLEAVCLLAAESLGDLCFARLLGDGGASLVPGAFHHPGADVRALVERALCHSWPSDMALVAGALAAGGPAVVSPPPEQIRAFCAAHGLAGPSGSIAGSMLLAPLRARGETLGLLAWCRAPARRPFGEREISLIETIAARTAYALEAAVLAAQLADQQKQTERVEESLRHSQEQLGQSQRMDALGRLASGVAHDFNNVLSVVLGYADLLLDEEDLSETARAKVQGILKAARHGAALTGQLLAYGRQQMLEPRVVDLNETVEGLADMLRRILGPGVEVRLVLSRDLGRVKLDPTQIQQVVLNLVINARDAMPEGGVLTVRTANELPPDAPLGGTRRWAMLSVGDTGVGMDAETVARIFEPFFTTKGPGKGTGLGLATVQGIVEQSGGRIQVDTSPDAGTTFRVYFPHSTEGACRKTSRPKLGAARGGETILLIEQDDDIRALMARFLERGGYRVLASASADEARLLSQTEPGTIALLLAAPASSGLGGLDVAAELHRARPEMRVLYLSTRGRRTPLDELQEDESFLQTPVARDVLLAKVRSVLDAAEGAGTPAG